MAAMAPAAQPVGLFLDHPLATLQVLPHCGVEVEGHRSNFSKVSKLSDRSLTTSSPTHPCRSLERRHVTQGCMPYPLQSRSHRAPSVVAGTVESDTGPGPTHSVPVFVRNLHRWARRQVPSPRRKTRRPHRNIQKKRANSRPAPSGFS